MLIMEKLVAVVLTERIEKMFFGLGNVEADQVLVASRFPEDFPIKINSANPFTARDLFLLENGMLRRCGGCITVCPEAGCN